MNKVIFLNKKQLMKLNHKERQDYLSTQKKYIRFQEPLMTGMIKHIENAHEFNKFQHKLDEDYLIETYEKVINTNYSKIKQKEKKEDKIPVVRETPVVREERIVEKNNGIKKDLKLPLSIIIAAIIIAVAIYYSSTSDYRNALKACEALMMSDGSVTKKDLKEQDVFKNYLIPECVSDKLKGND